MIRGKMGFYTKKQLMLESINLAIFLIMIFSASYFYSMLPENIPIHWNASGEADGFGSRDSVFILPFIYLGIYLLILFLPTIDVYRDNVKRSFKNYFGIRLSLGIFLLIIYLSTTLVNFYDIDVSRIVLISISLLFVSIGYFIKDIKRNYFAGIRTPWALNDERVWNETHSMSGKLFVATGLLLAVLASLLSMIIAFYIFISLIILISIYSVAYSYALYKRYNGKIYKK